MTENPAYRSSVATANSSPTWQTIEDYAEDHRLSVDDVWTLINEGGLMARCVNGQIFIFEPSSPDESAPQIERHQLPALTKRQGGEHQPHDGFSAMAQFSQDALDQIQQLNHELVAAKDALLGTRNQQLSQLQNQLAQRDQTIRQLQQNIEDLELLTQTLHDARSRAADSAEP
jgi:uncharacterized phage infection (PIP) family protein YhgE